MNETAHRSKQRRLLILVACFFFAPLGISFFLFYGTHGWRPTGQVNKGELIQPVVPLAEQALTLDAGGQSDPKVLRGKWTLLYVEADTCASDCLKHLYDTRQVRLALDRDMGRVQRMFIAPSDCCARDTLKQEHPDLIRVLADAHAESIVSKLPAAAAAHRVYLIDPLGNLMMFYAPDAPAKGMLSDMKRLLQYSQIG